MRRALLVGINHYKKDPLTTCLNDVELMKEVITRHEDGMPNFDCKYLISNPDDYSITTAKLKSRIYDLFNHETDVALLYFSGHGATTTVGNYLVTQDASKFDEGVSLAEIIMMANNSNASEVIIILDCCHGGGIANIWDPEERKALLREGVSLITASRDTQYAVGVGGVGLFTSIVYDALKGGAADILGKVNVARVYNYIDIMFDSWRQRPIFKSHVSKMIPIRNCTPKIPLEILRKLKIYFNGGKTGMPLSREYIADSDSGNGLVKIMPYLRAYHANGLLLPEKGIVSLDECAEKGKACVLTPLGVYYRDLVLKDRI